MVWGRLSQSYRNALLYISGNLMFLHIWDTVMHLLDLTASSFTCRFLAAPIWTHWITWRHCWITGSFFMICQPCQIKVGSERKSFLYSRAKCLLEIIFHRFTFFVRQVRRHVFIFFVDRWFRELSLSEGKEPTMKYLHVAPGHQIQTSRPG